LRPRQGEPERAVCRGRGGHGDRVEAALPPQQGYHPQLRPRHRLAVRPGDPAGEGGPLCPRPRSPRHRPPPRPRPPPPPPAGPPTRASVPSIDRLPVTPSPTAAAQERAPVADARIASSNRGGAAPAGEVTARASSPAPSPQPRRVSAWARRFRPRSSWIFTV